MNVLRTSFHDSSTTDTMLFGTVQHKNTSEVDSYRCKRKIRHGNLIVQTKIICCLILH